jgi:hypothetical protein
MYKSDAAHMVPSPRSADRVYYADGAAVLMAALAVQTSLPWPDEFPCKIERADKL